MKVYSVSAFQQRNVSNQIRPKKPAHQQQNGQNINFKSDNGALKGIFWGALIGGGAALLTVATGGLAAAVAAVGSVGVGGAGAGLGAHVGGIIGGLASGDENK